ncbi:STAS domain-containing protein [Metabacillus idriensis]|uniref:STAS domain-containing protein n=1 Tax=Metabacillus idriensis TaxID=324768 RepID=UPI0028146D7E|nr:STAS domain-containing protein [Metabacillus idriensis]MDR0137661.1 STAS domain-containing protein [Metabacillus idriensis]
MITIKNTLFEMSQSILSQKHILAASITEEQNKLYPDQLLPLSEQLLPLRVELVTLYGESIAQDDQTRAECIAKWGRETGRLCAQMGTTLDSMLNEVPHYRNHIGELIKNQAIKAELSLEEFYDVMSVLDQTVNEVVYYFSLPFVEFHDEQIRQSQEAIQELSVPVVPITDSLAVLPLAGTIDTHRAKCILEQVLQKSVQLKLDVFVIDLSGVPIIDTFVAHQIFQIIDALKLIGVDAKISGITPEIAQTVVNLGIDFGKTQTFSSLKQAMAASPLIGLEKSK